MQSLTSTSLTEVQTDTLSRLITQKYGQTVQYSADLTQEVRFLVIDTTDIRKSWLKSKKFMYVVAHRPDVKVIDYSSIVVDGTPLFKVTQVAPFAKLIISISRVDDELLSKTIAAIEANGGVVKHHLTNDTDVMVSMSAEGKRYAACLEWGVHVVSPDWCYDSIDRGLPLNTFFYRLQKNVTDYVTKLNYVNEEDTVGNEVVVKTYQLGKRSQACDWDKLKEWRDKESDRILEDYIKTKIEYDNNVQSSEANETLLNESLEEMKMKRKLIEIDDKDEEEDAVIVRIKKNKSKKQPSKVKPVQKEDHGKNIKKEKKGPILHGLSFKLLGYDIGSESKLKKVISKFGGSVFDEDTNFTVVNFKHNAKVNEDNAITELAIERFIFNEEVDDGSHFWCRPFFIDPSSVDLPAFRKHLLRFSEDADSRLKVAITSFEGTDLSHIERVFKEKLSHYVELKPVFREDCDILIVGPAVKESFSSHTTRKQNLANKWGVHVMSVETFHKKILQLAE